MIASGFCLWVIVVVDYLLYERRKFIVNLDFVTMMKVPMVHISWCPEHLCFAISHSETSLKVPGFLKSLNGAHVAWGTVSTMDMENVGIFQQYSTDLLIRHSKKRTRILVYNVIWVPEVVFYTFLDRMLYGVLAYRYTLSIVYPKC